MNQNIKKRLLRTVMMCAVALAIGGGLAAIQIKRGMDVPDQPKPKAATPMAGVQIGGPFTLVNQDGKTVTEKDFAGYKLIYFGFTSCPAICPTELAKLSKALNALGAQGEKIQPIFISVDPDRDTPKVLKDYISLFHPRLQGLTGTKEQLAETLKNYRIYAAKEGDGENYNMNHSNYIYFMNPKDELLSVYHAEDNAEQVANDVRVKMAGG